MFFITGPNLESNVGSELSHKPIVSHSFYNNKNKIHPVPSSDDLPLQTFPSLKENHRNQDMCSTPEPFPPSDSPLWGNEK